MSIFQDINKQKIMNQTALSKPRFNAIRPSSLLKVFGGGSNNLSTTNSSPLLKTFNTVNQRIFGQKQFFKQNVPPERRQSAEQVITGLRGLGQAASQAVIEPGTTLAQKPLEKSIGQIPEERTVRSGLFGDLPVKESLLKALPFALFGADIAAPIPGPGKAKRVAKIFDKGTDLAKEARKYKTAEEFMKNKALLFRGGFGNKVPDTYWLTSTEKNAVRFGRDAKSLATRGEDFIPDITPITDKGIKVERFGVKEGTKLFDTRTTPLPKEVLDKIGYSPEGGILRGVTPSTDRNTINAFLKKQGYEGSIWEHSGGNVHTAVFSKDSLLTKSQLTDIFNKAKGEELVQTLRGTKGLTADQIMQKFPDIQLKREISAKDIYGNKVNIPKGEALTPYELKDGKILLQDGEVYVVSKNQFANIKGQSVVGEAKEFAPELKGLEESVRGADVATVEANKIIKKYSLPQDTKLHEITGFLKSKGLENEAKQFESLPFSPTKFSQYQLPGGRDYSEIIIKAPVEEGKPIFTSSHFPEEKNPVAHLRRKIYDTKKYGQVEFMEEAQSDWARGAREQGFTKPDKDTAFKELSKKLEDKGYELDIDMDGSYFPTKNGKIVDYTDLPNDVKTTLDSYATKYETYSDLKEVGGVPFHPLVQGNKWQEPTVKRGLQEAVANDSDYFSWITGEQTSARYNLATHLDGVSWGKTSGANKQIKLVTKDKGTKLIDIDNEGKIGFNTASGDWKGKKLDEVLGKGLADSIMAKESGTLSGEGLKFGGEWANNLYDKQIKNIVEDVTGGKVVKLDMGLPIEAKGSLKWINTNTHEPLLPKDLKTGLKIFNEKDVDYIITDILGDGKFKAVPKDKIYKGIAKDRDASLFGKIGKNEFYNKNLVQEFDISTKTTTQQGIKLTPEIKAKIRGEAPQIKTSGKMF